MSTEENKQVFRRVIEEIINTGNLGLADELIAEDFVIHRTGLYSSVRVFKPTLWSDSNTGESVKASGRKNFKRGLIQLLTAFPDWHHTIHEMVAEGDMVAGRWSMSATHTGGTFLGIAPTHRRVTMEEAGIMRIIDGKLVEGWYLGDELNFLHELGVKFIDPHNISGDL